jgi:alginate O-acetyltransferase complex protein AlgI
MILLIASYIFYGVWSPPFILLLLGSTIIDFVVGQKLYQNTNETQRKLWLSFSLLGNLGPLAYFKYGGFLMENFTALVQSIGISYQAPAWDVVLPVGISFYTFQTLCYSLDMYHRKYAPITSFLDFSLFVSFFPQLVAGPIVRPDELVPQFAAPQSATKERFFNGLFLLTLGIFMKVVLADSLLAEPANEVFKASDKWLHTLDAWCGVLAFSGQIFFDFGGYSTCAIGIAMCLGFHIRDNFLYPYAAIGFSDFWRRWHITLSTWLRDYLYIPLGGNRHGVAKMYIALMLTMLIGGLWHGAKWTFLVWGGLHGIYLVIEKLLKMQKLSWSIPPIILALLTYFFVLITWVFFRAETFTSAWYVLGSMFTNLGIENVVLNYLSITKCLVISVLLLTAHWYMRDKKVLEEISVMPIWKITTVWTFMLTMIILSQESTSSFIYFQF